MSLKELANEFLLMSGITANRRSFLIMGLRYVLKLLRNEKSQISTATVASREKNEQIRNPQD
jgi:hypothetical protein